MSGGKSAGDIHCLCVINEKILDLLNNDRGICSFVMLAEYNVREGAIRWQILRLTSSLLLLAACSFVLAFTVFKMLTFKICDYENFGQGHVVQHS